MLSDKIEASKPLSYSSWAVADETNKTLFLTVVILWVSAVVGQGSGSWLYAGAALLLQLLTLSSMFAPHYIEVDSNGILVKTWRNKRHIAWNEINRYQVRQNGVLLLLSNKHFYLEAFRGFFLPIPQTLSAEILFRLQVFVHSP
jgi:hypothetical protein